MRRAASRTGLGRRWLLMALAGALATAALAGGAAGREQTAGDGEAPRPVRSHVSGGEACEAVLLGAGQRFNVFVREGYAGRATDIRGRLAAGGDVSIASFGVGAALPPDPARLDLIAGGSLTSTSAQVHNGSVRYGGTFSGSLSTPRGTLQQGAPPFDVAAEFAALEARSASLAGLTPNGAVSGPLYGALSLTGTDADLNVFELPKATLDRTQVIRLRVPQGSTTIVNIPAATYSTAVNPTVAVEIWDGSSYQQAGDTAPPSIQAVRQRLLWNFPNATSVQIGPSLAWQGSVLAPRAQVVFPNGTQLNGTILARDMSREVGGEAHHHPFLGCVPTPLPHIAPVVACVEDRGEDGLVAYFGYASPAELPVDVPVGAANRFEPAPPDRGQPRTFQPGTHANVVAVPFSGELTWRLPGGTATASASSPRCSATLRIDKVLLPSTDPARVDLLLDGEVAARAVSELGTTGARIVPAGPGGTVHTVGEAASPGTDLAAYDSAIACRDGGGDGAVIAQGAGTSLPVTIAQGAAVVCVVSNTRIVPPGPGTADLVVTKRASTPSAVVGDHITWTVTVTNRGPDPATDVLVVDVLPDGLAFVAGSLQVPAGITCASARCTIPTLPAGVTLSGSFETIATEAGTYVNSAVASAAATDPTPGDNADSDSVTVGGGAAERLTPLLECIEPLPNGRKRAHLGFRNAGDEPVSLPVGRLNAFTPPEDRGQPTVFRPGRAIDVFQVDFDDEVTWRLGLERLRVRGTQPACTATLRIDKVVVPARDPGRFELTLAGVPTGTGQRVGDGGTTGDVAVAATPGGTLHLVGEEGARGTSLAAYDASIVCRDARGRVVGSAEGAQLPVRVEPGDAIACTALNVARPGLGGQPLPPREPLGEPEPPAGAPDLAVTKATRTRTARTGAIVTWTMRVTNRGTAPATGVRLAERPPAGTTLLSLRSTAGTCAGRTCVIGTLAPGESATVTARTAVLTTGIKVDAAIVSTVDGDPDRANDVASAVVRVIGTSRAVTCASLRATPARADVGARTRVRVLARSRLGTPLAATAVEITGPGVRARARTDRRGRATIAVTPRRPGLLHVTVARAATDPADPAACYALVAVPPAVTG